MNILNDEQMGEAVDRAYKDFFKDKLPLPLTSRINNAVAEAAYWETLKMVGEKLSHSVEGSEIKIGDWVGFGEPPNKVWRVISNEDWEALNQLEGE